MLRIAIIITVSAITIAGAARAMDSSQGKLTVNPILTGLDEPWSFGFLPDGSLVVTERGGRLIFAGSTGTWTVDGLPRVQAQGQGGLLDVLVPRDFAQTRELLFTYAKRVNGQTVTALDTAQLSADARRLESSRTLFEMVSPSSGGRHFGSRLIEAGDGRIFMTIGDRGDMDQAQNTQNHNGTVIRLNRDGSVPSDNPFVGVKTARPEIWSYGHRNPQGAALDLQGNLWVNEHGAMGGDEINAVKPGKNYGWPVIAYGRHYTGAKIGEGNSKPGLEQPSFYWDPSIAPSGMLVYSGKLWPAWRGDFFIGSLKFDYISRVDPGQGWSEERLKDKNTGRVRDLREAPDGTIWFLSVNDGALYRISK